MYLTTRFAAACYVFSILAGGYTAVAVIKGDVSESNRQSEIKSLSGTLDERVSRTLLVFDSIEPAGGADRLTR